MTTEKSCVNPTGISSSSQLRGEASTRAPPPAFLVLRDLLGASGQLRRNAHRGDIAQPTVAGTGAGPDQVGSGEAGGRVEPALLDPVELDPCVFRSWIKAEVACRWKLERGAYVREHDAGGPV